MKKKVMKKKTAVKKEREVTFCFEGFNIQNVGTQKETTLELLIEKDEDWKYVLDEINKFKKMVMDANVIIKKRNEELNKFAIERRAKFIKDNKNIKLPKETILKPLLVKVEVKALNKNVMKVVVTNMDLVKYQLIKEFTHQANLISEDGIFKLELIKDSGHQLGWLSCKMVQG